MWKLGSVESMTAIGLSGIGGAIAAIVIAAPSLAATLDSWQFDPNTNQLVITVPKGVTPNYYLVAEPARIVVDLPNTDVGVVPMQQSYAGAVRSVRVAQFQAGLARIVIELSPSAVLAPGQVELQQLDSDGAMARWAVRPLLVTDGVDGVTDANPAIAAAPAATTAPDAAAPDATAAPLPASTAEMPLADTQPEATPANETVTTEAALPPLEPGAIEIPIEPPTGSIEAADPEPAEPISEPTAAAARPNPAESELAEPEINAENQPEARSEVDTETANTEVTPEVQPAPPARTTAETPTNDAPPRRVAVPPIAPSPPSVTAVSPPLPVDFSSPPSPLPDPATPTGSAAALSLPSVGSTMVTPTTVTPTARIASSQSETLDSLSFPNPTAEGVSVPSIDTVATQPEQPTGNLEPQAESQASSVRPAPATSRSRPVADPSRQTASRQATSRQATSRQATPRQTAAVPPPSAEPIPFGQPISGQATPDSSASVRTAIPFGQPIQAVQPSVQPSAPVKPIEVIPFGQPLPLSQSGVFVPVASSNPAPVTQGLISSGTVLKLRYPGQSALTLADSQSHQEVLLLEEPVRDRAGNILILAGSPVVGRFETKESSSHFIVQSVQVQGRNIALSAESESLSGDRQVSQHGLLRNSAIGAVAGTLLGAVTGIGLIPAVIAGAATSAATTYVGSPQGTALIQPNQVVEVRLTQDFSHDGVN